MKARKIFVATGLMLVSLLAADACTSIIVSGKYTLNGRPLLWKHRDTDNLHNVIRYFHDGRYSYVGVVNADDAEGTMVWGGYNDQGFAIMNTASYNIKDINDTTEASGNEGAVMKMALMYCSSLEDFEHLLDTMNTPYGLNSNFGCIDAAGGAAYYETNNFTYKKIDVNDPAMAPFGYIIHTNYSFYGDPDTGHGYIRYMAASDLFYKTAMRKEFSARYLLTRGSRSMKNGLTGRDLRYEYTAASEKMVHFRDHISRVTSASSVVIEGAPEGLGPEYTTMYTLLGWPLTTPVVPVWLAAEEQLPGFMKHGTGGRSGMCSRAFELKAKAFPYQAGHMNYYLNLNALLKPDGTGLLQKVEALERPVWKQEESLKKKLKGRSSDTNLFEAFYGWLENHLEKTFFTAEL